MSLIMSMIQRQKKGVEIMSFYVRYVRTISPATVSGEARNGRSSMSWVIGVSTKPGLTVSTWTSVAARRLRKPCRNSARPPLAAP